MLEKYLRDIFSFYVFTVHKKQKAPPKGKRSAHKKSCLITRMPNGHPYKSAIYRNPCRDGHWPSANLQSNPRS